MKRFAMGLVLAGAVSAATPAMAQTSYAGGGATIGTGPSSANSQGAAVPFPINFVVNQAGTITNVDFIVMGLNHTYASDLEFALVAPDGTNVLLLSDAGDSANFLNTDLTFDQAAATGLVTNPNTNFNYPSQTIRPTIVFGIPNSGNAGFFPFTPSTTNTLDAFNGLSATGTWRLYVRDDIQGDFGNFTGSTLRITTAVAAVPEPAGWALMIGGFGLAGAMLRRRRKPGLAAAA